jgi:iron complex outermembrane receptor protein
MTRSRQRKLKRARTASARLMTTAMPLAAAMVASLSPAVAQERDEGILESVIVTAQKRSENLQEVPVSIQAFSNETLEQLHIVDFDDYVKHLPSVSYQTIAPGFAQVYMRGIASGGDGNHSGSQPSVGIYLDEQPITTIQGALDVHLYDIARVEALAGPQGTLYGASSQAGTLRIITNKPDAGGFAAGYDLEGNTITDGGDGYLAQGFVNVPLGSRAAIRLVGWKRHDPGYIDNVFGTRTFPTSGITVDNADRVENDYNDVDTSGARAALKIDLTDNWTVTPGFMLQQQKTNGSFGFDPSVGEFQLSHALPDTARDRWRQAALTIEGKVANLDLVYAGSLLKRSVDTNSDYADYAYHYDRTLGYGTYFYDESGDLIDPSQFIVGKDRYDRETHELRISTPGDKRVRAIGGVFTQRQVHDIEQRYMVFGMAPTFEVTGWPDTIWLTEQERIDRDFAVFGEVSFDVTDQLTLTAGARYFEADNTLEGFFGYNDSFSTSGRNGEALCSTFAGDPIGDRSSFQPFVNETGNAPCTNLDRRVKESDTIFKLNAAYQFDDQRMVYVTWSEGFRPGGVNRAGPIPPYSADYLTNYEVGFKTTWADRFRVNGAIFRQDWDDFQFSFLDLNGLTTIRNASSARVDGIEFDASWAVTDGLTLSAGAMFIDSELLENYCGTVFPDGSPVTDCDAPNAPADSSLQAPAGIELPVTPDYKANMTARYEFPIGSFDAHVQGALVTQGSSWSDLRQPDREIVGRQPSYTLVDLSLGVRNDTYSIELFINNAFDELAEITRTTQCSILTPDRSEPLCGAQPYIVPYQPRTFGVKFGQKF